MTREDVSSLIDHFQEITRQGVTIVTWNGLGFDWQVLAEESGRQQECRQLALQHVDMMYHFFCHKGFPLALSTACQGMAVGEKQEGVTGLAAPHMWAAGQRQEVIDYCVQDAVITMKLASACAERGRLYWTARSGRPNQLLLPQGWKTVQEATEIPPPNTSWMTDPIPRASLDSWLSPAGE